MSKITIIHHSADYDGIFCREITRKFMPDAELIGWDFPDAPLKVPSEGAIYILDLPADRVFGLDFLKADPSSNQLNYFERLTWIDHHASSIDTHPPSIPGYRIDGVAACRLAWQWFTAEERLKAQSVFPKKHGEWMAKYPLPTDVHFKNREVLEPLAVRLAGEYDIWDHRGDGDLEFQFGLDAQESIPWAQILATGWGAENITGSIVADGRAAMHCYGKRDSDIMRSRSFKVQWEGLTFLVLNTARCNSNSFSALDVPETGHDALMAFYLKQDRWYFSLYHAAHRKELDLSQIATKYGGGGHRGACGFQINKLPFPA